MTSYARWKAKEYRDLSHWREWIHTQDCARCGRNSSQMAHVGERGLGAKSSDLFAIPLCEHCHLTAADSQHKVGKEFWRNSGLDRERLIHHYHARYLDEIKRRPDLIAKFQNALAASSRRALISA